MTEIKEGDRIRIKGYEYEVEMVDTFPHNGEVTQYRISPVGAAPEANLKPNSDGSYTVVQYRKATEEQVVVLEDDDE